eukprot:14722763-Alexandrium_andersonii.AAC.1
MALSRAGKARRMSPFGYIATDPVYLTFEVLALAVGARAARRAVRTFLARHLAASHRRGCQCRSLGSPLLACADVGCPSRPAGADLLRGQHPGVSAPLCRISRDLRKPRGPRSCCVLAAKPLRCSRAFAMASFFAPCVRAPQPGPPGG